MCLTVFEERVPQAAESTTAVVFFAGGKITQTDKIISNGLIMNTHTTGTLTYTHTNTYRDRASLIMIRRLVRKPNTDKVATNPSEG